jgi:hypothetical protein
MNMDETQKVEPTFGPAMETIVPPSPLDAAVNVASTPALPMPGLSDSQVAAMLSAIQPSSTQVQPETIVEKVEDFVNKEIGAIDPSYRLHHPVHGNGGTKEIYRFANDKGAVVLTFGSNIGLTPVHFPTPTITSYVADGDVEEFNTVADLQTRLQAIKGEA